MFVSKNAVLMAYCHLKKFREKGANRMKMASFRHGELLFLLPSPSKYYFHDQVSSTAIDFQQYCYRQVSTTSTTSLVVLPQFQCRAAGQYPFTCRVKALFTCRVKALFTHWVKALFTHRVKALFTHRVKALFTHRVIAVFRDFMDNYPVFQQHSQSVGGKTPAECYF